MIYKKPVWLRGQPTIKVFTRPCLNAAKINKSQIFNICSCVLIILFRKKNCNQHWIWITNWFYAKNKKQTLPLFSRLQNIKEHRLAALIAKIQQKVG